MPEFNFNFKKRGLFFTVITISVVLGFIAGGISGTLVYLSMKPNSTLVIDNFVKDSSETENYTPQTSQEQSVIEVVKNSSPAVVSVIATKEVPVYEQYLEFTPFGTDLKRKQNGTEKQELGQGTGFIVSEEGLVLTNKHVVVDEKADYTVFTNTGKKYEAKVLARDPVQDLAVLEIVNKDGAVFPVLKLGDSDGLETGQTVVAIGNALGEFRNTVSVGVISGLSRRITASDSSGSFVETLDNVIQTDTAINKGNSGGPLLNLKGEVIGINTAVVTSAQSIGFAVPSNKAKRAISQVLETGKIVYPFIGIRYVLINESIKEEESLDSDHGALIISGSDGEPAVEPGSAAAKAGLKKDDIILELEKKRIDLENPLSEAVLNYNPGDKVEMKILRNGQEMILELTLGER